MTPRETAIEVMARANDPMGWALFDKPTKPEFDEVKARFQASQIKNMAAALDALLAALPGLGMQVVTTRADDNMEHAAIDADMAVDPFGKGIVADYLTHWEAMLAASTNPLEKSE